MSPRHRRSPVADYQTTDPDYEPLIVLIRRLSAHRGYDRDALLSPMLKRLMPVRRSVGDALAVTAELRTRLAGAGLDRRALAYLTESAETELDFARLRLT